MRRRTPHCPCYPRRDAPVPDSQVVEQGPGQWYCEYSGTTLPSMVRRYILQVHLAEPPARLDLGVAGCIGAGGSGSCRRGLATTGRCALQ